MSENNLASRKNEGKLRWRNFPPFMMRPLAQVAQFGERKYTTYNYLKGGSQNQYLDCIHRHIDQYEDPEEDDLDAESRVSHLAHVAWNALTAIYMLEHYPELDDRFKLNEKENRNILKEFDEFLLNNAEINHEDRETATELVHKFIHKDEVNKA